MTDNICFLEKIVILSSMYLLLVDLVLKVQGVLEVSMMAAPSRVKCFRAIFVKF